MSKSWETCRNPLSGVNGQFCFTKQASPKDSQANTGRHTHTHTHTNGNICAPGQEKYQARLMAMDAQKGCASRDLAFASVAIRLGGVALEA